MTLHQSVIARVPIAIFNIVDSEGNLLAGYVIGGIDFPGTFRSVGQTRR
jgi:hypothetical protein